MHAYALPQKVWPYIRSLLRRPYHTRSIFYTIVVALFLVLMTSGTAWATNPVADATVHSVSSSTAPPMYVPISIQDSTEVSSLTCAAQLEPTSQHFQAKLSYLSRENLAGSTLVSADPTGITVDTSLSHDFMPGASSPASSRYTLTWAALFDGIQFTAPGVYTFKLATDTHNPNITTDPAQYTITVQVNVDATDPTKLAIQDTGKNVLTGTPGQYAKATGNQAAFTVVSNAGSDLVLTSRVAGNMANIQDQFTYKIYIQKARGTYTYTAPAGVALQSESLASATDQTLTLGARDKGTFYVTLSHGQQLMIAGLPVDAVVVVTNTEKPTGYTTSVEDSSRNTPGGTTDGQIKVARCTPPQVNTVIMTHTLDGAVTPTGVSSHGYAVVVLVIAAPVLAITLWALKRRQSCNRR